MNTPAGSASGLKNSDSLLVDSWLKPRDYLPVFAVYLAVTLFARAHFMADTADYVASVLGYDAGYSAEFWEFGHLFWRPIIWLCYVTLRPLTRHIIGSDPGSNVIVVTFIINWIAGLVSVFMLQALCGLLCTKRWIVYFVPIVFIFCHGFLNYFQTGSSYVPALALSLVGFYVVARWKGPQSTLLTALLAGLALAGAVCMWFPFVLSIPAVVLAPLVLFKIDKQTIRLVVITLVCVSIFGALAYGLAVVGMLGITSVAGFRAWQKAASHDTEIRGVTRMVFGLARSFIYMGSDGIVFKRYLLKDPFNPVTLLDLLRLSLWKLGLFYVLIAAMCLSLLQSARGRKMFVLLALSAVPMLLFAIFFDGGAIERYFPLYPAIFLSLAVGLCTTKSLPLFRYLAIVFGVVVVLANGAAMAKPVLDREQQESVNRVDALLPVLKPNSRIVTVNWQDDLINFGRSFPLHPINVEHSELRIGALVTPGTTYAAKWREEFAKIALKAWREGGDVWVSTRALSPKPQAGWNWVEGDVEDVSWSDFSRFFADLDLGETVGGSDGFFKVLPTAKNQELLNNLLQKQAAGSLRMKEEHQQPGVGRSGVREVAFGRREFFRDLAVTDLTRKFRAAY
jgi:hypothetical protein